MKRAKLFLLLIFISVLFSSCDKYKTCSNCHGRGTITTSETCSECGGAGEKRCTYEATYKENRVFWDMFAFKKHYRCNGGYLKSDTGGGEHNNKACPICNGRGFNRCSECSGSGRISTTIDCPNCNGNGKILTEYGKVIHNNLGL